MSYFTEKKLKACCIAGALFIILLNHGPLFAWDAEITHNDLSAASAKKSKNLDKFLTDFGFSGLDDKIVGITIKEFIREGNVQEDATTSNDGFRGVNHFHNPLKPWPEAGLDDLFSGQSSLLWAQQTLGTDLFIEPGNDKKPIYPLSLLKFQEKSARL